MALSSVKVLDLTGPPCAGYAGHGAGPRRALQKRVPPLRNAAEQFRLQCRVFSLTEQFHHQPDRQPGPTRVAHPRATSSLGPNRSRPAAGPPGCAPQRTAPAPLRSAPTACAARARSVGGERRLIERAGHGRSRRQPWLSRRKSRRPRWPTQVQRAGVALADEFWGPVRPP